MTEQNIGYQYVFDLLSQWSERFIGKPSPDLVKQTSLQSPIGPLLMPENEYSRSHWIFTIQNRESKDSSYYNYEAILSRPSRENPIPACTASILFRYFPSEKRMEYQYKGSNLVYKLARSNDGQWKGHVGDIAYWLENIVIANELLRKDRTDMDSIPGRCSSYTGWYKEVFGTNPLPK